MEAVCNRDFFSISLTIKYLWRHVSQLITMCSSLIYLFPFGNVKILRTIFKSHIHFSDQRQQVDQAFKCVCFWFRKGLSILMFVAKLSAYLINLAYLCTTIKGTCNFVDNIVFKNIFYINVQLISYIFLDFWIWKVLRV